MSRALRRVSHTGLSLSPLVIRAFDAARSPVCAFTRTAIEGRIHGQGPHVVCGGRPVASDPHFESVADSGRTNNNNKLATRLLCEQGAVQRTNGHGR